MTKKDYIKFAEMFAFRYSVAEDYLESATIDNIVRDVIDIFKQDNPRFDEQKFKDACNNWK